MKKNQQEQQTAKTAAHTLRPQIKSDVVEPLD